MITIQKIDTITKAGVDIPHCASLRLVPLITPQRFGVNLYPIVEIIGEDGSVIASLALSQAVTVRFSDVRARQLRLASNSPVASVQSLTLITSSNSGDVFSGMDQVLAGQRYLGAVGTGSALGCSVVTQPIAVQALVGAPTSLLGSAPIPPDTANQPQHMVLTLQNLGPNDVLLNTAGDGIVPVDETCSFHVRPGEVWQDQVDLGYGGPVIQATVKDQVSPLDCRIGWKV